jgi:hypothetical protein
MQVDVRFLHTGEPVLVIEEGEGEPGGYVVGPNRQQVWQENGDYRPAKVVRLGVLEEVEQGSIGGTSPDDTATAARAAAIEAGDHPETEGVSYVYDANAGAGADTPAGNGSPAVSGPVGTGGAAAVTPAPAEVPPGGFGADTPPDALEPLNDDERAELAELRAFRASQETAREHPAPDLGRDTTTTT